MYFLVHVSRLLAAASTVSVVMAISLPQSPEEASSRDQRSSREQRDNSGRDNFIVGGIVGIATGLGIPHAIKAVKGFARDGAIERAALEADMKCRCAERL